MDEYNKIDLPWSAFTFFFRWSFCIHKEYVANISYEFSQISMHELQIMRLTGLHPLNNPEFLALVKSPTHASKNAAWPIPSRHQFFHQQVPTVANGTPQLHTTTPNSYFWTPTKWYQGKKSSWNEFDVEHSKHAARAKAGFPK